MPCMVVQNSRVDLEGQATTRGLRKFVICAGFILRSFKGVRPQTLVVLGLLLLALASCQPKKVEMDEAVWRRFSRSLDFRREYAMRREITDVLYLRRALTDSNNLIRFNAAQDLVHLGEDAGTAAPELIACAESKPIKVARLCAKSLQAFSPLPDIAIVSLLPKVGVPFSSSSHVAT